ncbi:hypothetical protein ACS0TY_001463 [Phlomoides rotata]
MEQSEFDNITTRNYDHLTLNVKVSGNVQQVNLDIVQTYIDRVRYAQHLLWQALKLPLLKVGSTSVTQKGKVHQAEPQQTFHASNRLILTLQISNHVGGLTVHWKIYSKDQDSGHNILLLMYLVNIRDFGHSNEQTPLMLTDGTSLELSPHSILLHQYPSFHSMKLQRPDKKAFTYIKKQETKPALVVNLTKDEISTMRAWRV